jgi:Fibronectin type III domain
MKKLLFLISFISTISTSFLAAQALCTPPNMTYANPGVDGCSLVWSNVNRNTLFTIRYRIATDSVWSEAIAQAAPADSIVNFRLTGLRACTGYVYQVRTTCAGVVSTFSTLSTFQTIGCNSACPLPAGLATYTRDSMALLYWSGSATQYQVQYRAAGAAAFTTVTTSTPNATIAGLQPCTYYEFKVKAICSAAVTSDFTGLTRFKTTGCAVTTTCGVPRITALSVNGTVITVSWASTGTTTYQLRYKRAADSTWTTVSATNTTAQIGNLIPCTVYQFQLRSICNGNIYSEFSVSGSLATAGCTPVSYCSAPRRLSFTTTNTVAVLRWDSTGAASYDVQWMAPRDSAWRTVRVTTNRLELGSLTACTIYQFRVRANCSATSYAYSAIARFATTGCVSTVCAAPTNVRVSGMDTLAVVAWNANGATSFRVQYKATTDSLFTTVTTTTPYVTLTNLIRCKAYQVKVQAICSNNLASAYTEPVRFETRGCAPTCLMPTNVTVHSSDSTNALVTWHAMAGSAYVVEYYPADAPNSVVTRTTSDSLVRLTGLTRCKTYVFRVRRACGTNLFSDWASTRIITTGCVSTCSAPNGLLYERFSDSLMWNSTGTYTLIRWRLAGTAVWSYDSVARLSRFAFGSRLQACQMYGCQVQNVCPTGISDWTPEFSFLSRGANCADGGGSGVQIRDFGIYPNPGMDVVQVMYKLEQSAMAVRLDLVDLQGKIIRQLDGGQQDTGNYIQSFEGLEPLNSGLYMVVLRVDGKVAMTQKWVKE